MFKKFAEGGINYVRVACVYAKDEYLIMWVRDTVKSLKAQLSKAVHFGEDKNFFFEPFQEKNRKEVPYVSHYMNRALASRVIPDMGS